MHAAQHRPGARIAVVHAEGHFRIFATSPFAQDDPVLAIEGAETRRPTRYSIQVDDGLHVQIPEGTTDLHAIFDRYAWRFLNHSCAPNTAVRGRTVVAIRPIAAWDEVTFDYNTTELAMASPFDCRCGHCDGRRIGGFLLLPPEERERLRPWLAPHALRRLA